MTAICRTLLAPVLIWLKLPEYPLANKDNDYVMDREAQRRGTTYSGIESMGPIVDRTKENLVSTDNGIIMARHRLMKAARELAKGISPPGHRSRASEGVVGIVDPPGRPAI